MFPSHVIELPFGKGLAASKDLEAGVVVQRFEGEIVNSYDLVPKEEKIYALWFDYPDKWMIYHSDARYANHSCSPNSTLVRNASGSDMVTIKPVKAGEQITFTYNVTTEDGFWDPLWTFDCFCGSDNCMKRVESYVDKNHKKFT